MLEKEKLLKQQRTSEAIDKDYMGLEGKFGIILKTLGKPIIQQGSNNYESTEFQDVFEVPDEDGLPEQDPDSPIREIGKIFDGLKFGHHLEITYLKSGTVPIKIDEYYTGFEEAPKVLKVLWKGYVVYLEAEGDLFVFNPSAEWEDVVLKVYQSAVKLAKKHKIEVLTIAEQEAKQKKMSFLERLRERWGI